MIQRMKFIPALFLMLLVLATSVLKGNIPHVEAFSNSSKDEISSFHFSDRQSNLFEIHTHQVSVVHQAKDSFQRTITPYFSGAFSLIEGVYFAKALIFTGFLARFSISESKNKLLYPFHFFW